MVTEQDYLAEWKATEGAFDCLRFEENALTDTYSLSPTPDEAIDSEIEILAINFENWMEKVHPEVVLSRNGENYPQVLIQYVDEIFHLATRKSQNKY